MAGQYITALIQGVGSQLSLGVYSTFGQMLLGITVSPIDPLLQLFHREILDETISIGFQFLSSLSLRSYLMLPIHRSEPACPSGSCGEVMLWQESD